MGTTSRSHKPNEWAAKVNHSHLINDPFIKDFISNCEFPSDASELKESDLALVDSLDKDISNPIKYILAVDGGYTTVEVKKGFPSSQIAFFQFGALLFSVDDLEALSEKPFIFPEDMKKLNDLQRYKLALPIQTIAYKNQPSLNDSIRKTIYDFFMAPRDGSSFMETLSWFLFQEYEKKPCDSYTLSHHPCLGRESEEIELRKSLMKEDYTFENPHGRIFLTDVFRLDEIVDEDLGAAGMLGYVTRLIEQLIIVHFIRSIYRIKTDSLHEFLFIADGPLVFSGQTANMHRPMRNLCNFFYREHNLFLVGLEKSGAFIDHAQAVCLPSHKVEILKQGQYLMLSNNYIYKYIKPGDSNKMHYGSTSYYGGKVIFHSYDGQVIVLTVPVPNKDVVKHPRKEDYYNLEVIMLNIQKLRCDMYDDAIVPIALANKLVSLANHPSKILLEKFASKGIKKDRP
jgi:hypothetical protein